MQLTGRQKRVLKWVGYPALALVTFVVALHLTFPYERVEDKVIEFLSDKYDVTISSTEPTLLPGGIIFKGVALQTRPDKPDDKPTTIFLDEVTLDVGILALIGGDIDVDIEAVMGDGVVEGNVRIGDDEVYASIATERLPTQDIPGLRGVIGLPVKGGLNVKGWLRLPQKRWDKLDGKLTLSCASCTMGDGETRLQIKPRKTRSGRIRRPIFSEGPVVPELQLGSLSGTLEVESGRGKFLSFGAESPHGELKIYGGVRFSRRLRDARFDAGTCMRFRLSDALKQEHKEFGNFPELMGVPPNDDGTSNVSIRGKVPEMRWVPARSCDPDQRGGDRDERPSISARPRPTPTPATLRGGLGTGDGAEPPPGADGETDNSDDTDEGGDGPEGPRELDGPGSAGPNLSEAAKRAILRGGDDVRPPDLTADPDQPPPGTGTDEPDEDGRLPERDDRDDQGDRDHRGDPDREYEDVPDEEIQGGVPDHEDEGPRDIDEEGDER